MTRASVRHASAGGGGRVRGLIASAVCASLIAGTGCSRVPVMRGEIQGLEQLIKQADKNGARRCAPRELALAVAHAKFADVELGQANMFRAEDHLIVARANAQAAYDLSPAAQCTDRGFVIDEPPPKPKPKPAPPPKPGDKDGDGWLDPEDKCPEKPENYNGFEDTDGCPDEPDTDGDGIVDLTDDCELLAEDKDGYLDDDGCPDLDNDLDSVLDTKEAKPECVSLPEDPDGHEDSDGCPEPDNDGDAVADLEDECPFVPGVKDGARKGCPQKAPLVVVTEREIKITQQIHFAFAKAIIRPESFAVLDAVVSVLKDNPQFKIEVQGHTDNVGSAALNKKLSQQRADSVRKYLVDHGVAAERLAAKGFGMERPLVPNTDERNRALNRRVQFLRVENK